VTCGEPAKTVNFGTEDEARWSPFGVPGGDVGIIDREFQFAESTKVALWRKLRLSYALTQQFHRD
jgi:hypothetical protein